MKKISIAALGLVAVLGLVGFSQASPWYPIKPTEFSFSEPYGGSWVGVCVVYNSQLVRKLPNSPRGGAVRRCHVTGPGMFVGSSCSCSGDISGYGSSLKSDYGSIEQVWPLSQSSTKTGFNFGVKY